MLASPIPVRVVPHPYLAGRWTHIIAERDARRRGWHFFGDAPFGTWRTQEAARRAARRLQARGIISIRRTPA